MRFFFTNTFAANPLLASALILLTLVTGVLPAVEVILLGRVVDVLASAGDQGLRVGIVLCGALFIVFVLGKWLMLISQEIEDTLRDQISRSLFRDITRHTTDVELAEFDTEEIYNEFSRVHSHDMHFRIVNLFREPIDTARSVVGAVSYALVLTSADWRLGVGITLAFIPSLYFKVNRARERYIHDYNTLTPARKQMSYFDSLLSTREAAQEVRVFNAFTYLAGKWRDIHRIWKTERLKDEAREARAFVWTEVVLALSYGLTLLFLVILVLTGQVSLGGFVVVTRSVAGLQTYMESVLFRVKAIYQDGLFAAGLLRFLRMTYDQKMERGEVHLGEEFAVLKCENVWFQYRESGDWVLKGVNLELKPGEVLSIIGPNGSGKSTLVALLAGLYLPDKGQVTINGVPVTDLSLAERKRLVSVVFQDYAKIELSLRESVGLGQIDRLSDDGFIASVCDRAGLRPVLERLGENLDTMLSPAHGGTSLSGGEWQRVALARSLTNQDGVFILDEPTSSLDPLSEQAFYRESMRAAGAKATIVLTHRLGPASTADRILLLDQGVVVGYGTHRELMNSNELYRNMYEAQRTLYDQVDHGLGGEANAPA